MGKGGANIGERSAAGCGTCLVRMFFVLIVLFGIYMVLNVIGVMVPGYVGQLFPGSGQTSILDFLDFARLNHPESYTKARAAKQEHKDELAIKHYREFFKNDADDAPEDVVVQAHLDCMIILYEFYRSGTQFSDRAMREKCRQESKQHCEALLRLRPKHSTAQEYQHLLALDLGEG